MGQALKDGQNLKMRSGRKRVSKLERREGSVGVRHGESSGEWCKVSHSGRDVRKVDFK